MAYGNFSLQDVTQKLGVTIRTTPNLFGQVPAVPVRASVLELLREPAPPQSRGSGDKSSISCGAVRGLSGIRAAARIQNSGESQSCFNARGMS